MRKNRQKSLRDAFLRRSRCLFWLALWRRQEGRKGSRHWRSGRQSEPPSCRRRGRQHGESFACSIWKFSNLTVFTVSAALASSAFLREPANCIAQKRRRSRRTQI